MGSCPALLWLGIHSTCFNANCDGGAKTGAEKKSQKRKWGEGGWGTCAIDQTRTIKVPTLSSISNSSPDRCKQIIRRRLFIYTYDTRGTSAYHYTTLRNVVDDQPRDLLPWYSPGVCSSPRCWQPSQSLLSSPFCPCCRQSKEWQIGSPFTP